MGDMADWTNEMGEQGADYDRRHPDELLEPEPPDGEVGEVVCPKCGSAMALRDGKFGKFLGCENFPRCRGNRSIEQWNEEPEPMPNKTTWDIERAFEVVLGDHVTEDEMYDFGDGRVKYTRIAAENFVREFIKQCKCQPRERKA